MNTITTSNIGGGTHIVIKNSIQDFTNRFQLYADKCAENILEMCKIVYDASIKLKKKEFAEFIKAIGMTKQKGTISKFKMIGQRYDELSLHKAQLPSTWTTLYNIARCNENQINEGISNGKIHPMMKASAVKEIAPELYKSRPATKKEIIASNNLSQADFGIEINENMIPDARKKFLQEIQTIVNNHMCKIIMY